MGSGDGRGMVKLRLIVSTVLVVCAFAPAVAEAFNLTDAYATARDTGRRVARLHDADSFRVTRCWATGAHRGYCTVRYTGFAGGAVDCYDRLRMFETRKNGKGYMNSRFSYSTCPE